jgi:hypothetical protein
MADKDIAWQRWMDQRVAAMRALEAFLRERGVDATRDGDLYGHVFSIHGWLGRFDNREARRFELDRMERVFWSSTRPSEHQLSGRRAVALWRLHQQLSEADDLLLIDRDQRD